MASPVIRDSTLRSHCESVERVIEAMKLQLDQPMPLESMARIACASPYHFNRTFRQITGLPPAQFLYALRLDAARRLLMQTQRRVIDICYDVGYNSVGTFTRRFTDLLGISPRQLRALARAARLPQNREADTRQGRPRRSGQPVSGYIRTPAGFHGLIFAGLFQDPIPQGEPLACAAPTEGGFYRIDHAPEGESYVFAVGIRYPVESPSGFHYDSALRAGGNLLRIGRHSVDGSTDLTLRPPSPFDPPILLVLPHLMERFAGGKKTAPARNQPQPLEARQEQSYRRKSDLHPIHQNG